MTYSDEIRRRMQRLGLDADALPELLPCVHCRSTDQIEIGYSVTDGTFAITCMMDGWTTSDHAELLDALNEWNAEQRRAAERQIRRALYVYPAVLH